MSYHYKKAYVPGNGYTPVCKIGECSLKRLEFGIIELDAGQKLPFYTEGNEVAFIMLEGHCNVEVNGEIHKNIGNRMTVFENRKAESFYMPKEQALTIEAIDHIKIAVCGTPVIEKTEPQVLREDHVVLKRLGRPPFERETSFIIDENSNAKILTIGEAYCTEGPLMRDATMPPLSFSSLFPQSKSSPPYHLCRVSSCHVSQRVHVFCFRFYQLETPII